MRRVGLILALLALLAACGDDDDATGATTTAASTTTEVATTTTGTTSSTLGTTTTTTIAPTTTAPGTTAVDWAAYCVRGTSPDDALNVRSGPGTDFAIVGELAWNAAAVPSGRLSAPDSQGRAWLLVESPSGPGWAASWYLEPAPCSASAITEAALAGPEWPDALAGGLVPWTWVDRDWVLALYSPDWEGDYALYLLSPYGDVYEVFSWTADAYAFGIEDWRLDGRAALVDVGFHGGSGREIRLIDLTARTSRTVLTIADFAFEGAAAFTRPAGRDLVIQGGDAATELLEVRRTDGSLFSTLLERPRPAAWTRRAAWLYGLEGTTVVLGDGDGLQLLSNMGDWIRDLATPGAACRPVRWWDADTILARCLAPEVLAYEPDGYYGRLWLVPADGGAASPLTALPPEPVDIVDFGFFDARQAGGQVFANWAGDCGAGMVDLVHADGSTETVTDNALVGVSGGNLVVRRWTSCDQAEGSLHLVAPDGTGTRDLLTGPADAPGVIDAVMLDSP